MFADSSMKRSRMGRVVLVAAAGAMLSLAAMAADGPVIAVTGGKVQGVLVSATGQAVFKGIPFAVPPVGDLRWREPMPVKPWAGVKDASDYANTCAQSDSGWNKNSAAKASEDCLYLNVWAPEWPAKSKHAVMVWIHGGGNGGGSALGAGGIEPPFNGESLARHGVVLVTIQYRLGLFGFIGHPELTAESPNHASGNYGLEDQVAALKWVKENIAKFGGDPANVTVFGQSAGAQDLSILLTSPAAKGLITKAIAESGSPMISDKVLNTQAQEEQMGVVLAAALKAPATEQVKYMRSLSAADILAASAEFRKNLKGPILDVGMDNYVVPQFSPAVYLSGKEMAIPMIVGNNSAEGGGGGGGPRGGGAPPTADELRATLKTRIDSTYGKYADLQERAEKAYGFTGDTSLVSTYPPYGSVDTQFGTDLFMRCEDEAMSAWHSAVATTYRYEFTGGTAAHPPVHSAELALVFGVLADQGSDAKVTKLSEDMEQYWTNFAKTGDPNGARLPKWPKYDAAGKQYIDLGNDGPQAKAKMQAVPCAIYQERLTRDIEARKGM